MINLEKMTKNAIIQNHKKYLILATCTQYVLNVILQRWLRHRSKCQCSISTP